MGPFSGDSPHMSRSSAVEYAKIPDAIKTVIETGLICMKCGLENTSLLLHYLCRALVGGMTCAAHAHCGTIPPICRKNPILAGYSQPSAINDSRY